MTAKEQFLARIANEIATLQAAYDANKNLPDSFFAGFATTPIIQPPVPPVVANILSNPVISIGEDISGVVNAFKDVNDQAYGANKKLVVQILKDAKKAITKADIIIKFQEMSSAKGDQTSTVTNAMASLAQEKAIIGHKPDGIKLKGYYWGLQSWFENGNLKEEYKPKAPQTSISRWE